MDKGKLIVLESLDAGGKSTQVKYLHDYFQQKGLSSIDYHFPMYGQNEFADIISKYLRGEFGKLSEVNPYFISNAYAMDRFMFKDSLEKSLRQYDIVILDRYVMSNMAFQAAKYTNWEEGIKLAEWIESFEYKFLDLPKPYKTIFLDCHIDAINERLNNRSVTKDKDYLQGTQKDIHEADIAYQSKVRDYYLHFTFKALDTIKIQAFNVVYDKHTTNINTLSRPEMFDKIKNILDIII